MDKEQILRLFVEVSEGTKKPLEAYDELVSLLNRRNDAISHLVSYEINRALNYVYLLENNVNNEELEQAKEFVKKTRAMFDYFNYETSEGYVEKDNSFEISCRAEFEDKIRRTVGCAAMGEANLKYLNSRTGKYGSHTSIITIGSREGKKINYDDVFWLGFYTQGVHNFQVIKGISLNDKYKIISKEEKEGYKNRHNDPLPNESCLIEIIIEEATQLNNIICTWLPFKRENFKLNEQMPSYGYLGTAIKVKEWFERYAIGYNVYENNDSEFIYYRIIS